MLSRAVLAMASAGLRGGSRGLATGRRGQQENRRFNRWYLLPFPVVTFCLGTWQVYRLHWKQELILLREERMHAEPSGPMPGAAAVLADLDAHEYELSQVEGSMLHHSQSFLYPRFHGGKPGVHLLTPFLRTDVHPPEIILVNRGWLPEADATATAYYPPHPSSLSPRRQSPSEHSSHSQSPSQPLDSIGLDAQLRLRGVIRRPELAPPSAFTPANQPQQRRWYWLDAGAILGHELALRDRLMAGRDDPASHCTAYPLVLDLASDDSASDDGYLPLANQTSVNLRNNHMQYVVTWYGLTIGLLFMLMGG
ncbi:MAG: SURF1 family protein [archaeon]|nr:SURF1 family protein [archaeon]